MDPITHSLVGGLVAKTARTSERRFWIMMFLGEAPDLDFIFEYMGPSAYWLQHRGFSHSLTGVVVQALFAAFIFRSWDKGPFRNRFALYMLPLLLHMVCDYMTSFGVPVFSPFSFREYSGNLMPAVTLIPLIFMSVGLFHMVRKKNDGWRAARWMWAAWGVTLLAAASGKIYAAKIVGEAQGPVTVVPGLVKPYGWTAVTRPHPCCSYQTHWVNSLTGAKVAGLSVQTDMESPPIQSSLKSPVIKLFMETVRWPVARVLPNEGGSWTVEWGRMIFSSRGMIRGFWSIPISSKGEAGEAKRIFNFWEPHESV